MRIRTLTQYQFVFFGSIEFCLTFDTLMQSFSNWLREWYPLNVRNRLCVWFFTISRPLCNGVRLIEYKSFSLGQIRQGGMIFLLYRQRNIRASFQIALKCGNRFHVNASAPLYIISTQ